MRTSLSIIAVLALTACSNGSSSSDGVAAGGDANNANGDFGLTFTDFAAVTDPAPTEDSAAFLTASGALNTAVADIDGRTLESFNFTRFDAVPTTGSASYSGMMNVNAGEDANVAAGLGLDVNFATNAVAAEQTTQFYANSDGNLVAYEGELTLGGFLRARNPAENNNVRLDVEGTLIGDGNTIVVDGEVLGKTVGTPIVGISANTTVADAIENATNRNEDGDVVSINTERLLDITLNGETVTDGSVGFVVVADPVAAESD